MKVMEVLIATAGIPCELQATENAASASAKSTPP